MKILHLQDNDFKIEDLAKTLLGSDWDGSESPVTTKQLEYIAQMEKELGISFIIGHSSVNEENICYGGRLR